MMKKILYLVLIAVGVFAVACNQEVKKEESKCDSAGIKICPDTCNLDTGKIVFPPTSIPTTITTVKK